MPNYVTIESQINAADNLNDPVPSWNRPATILGTTLAFSAITSVCVSFRLHTRFFVLRVPGWDDYMMATAMLVGVIGVVCMCLAPFLGGLGEHFVELSAEKRKTYFFLFYLADGSFVTSVGMIKSSLLLQYLRVFKRQTVHRDACVVVLVAVAIWGSVTTFMAWFPCFPIKGYWDWSIKDRKCYGYGSLYVSDHYATFLAHSIANMMLDIIILVLPTPLLWDPDTVKRTKLGIAGLLTLGLIANILAVLRLAETVKHKAMSHPTFDHSWYAPPLCLLGMLEVNVACIGASIPVFWPVIRSTMNAIFVTREIDVQVASRSMHLERSESLYSHDNSDGERRLWNSNSRGESSHKEHYKDTYIMDHVDPLRKKKSGAVDSVITADRNKY
ncbi:unnamed protein product [Clonostachys solani]|uniref:Rhodopsin domain-containing protein n=1 Tax=Clonostachys solani TaxID=160281 RepID=A0A9P0EL45_9HYPO|nr:unnamed protein product [Clonostachys solani]